MEKRLEKEISGSEAVKHVDALSKLHRIAGSSGFHSAVSYCVERLKEYGLDEIRVDKYPLDGKYKALSWTLPLAWEVEDVELRVVEPVDEAVVSFNETPTCIYWWSGPTPPNGITAELVFVGSGTAPEDYKGKDIRGKIVLAEGPGDTVYRLAVDRYGAVGVLTSFIVEAPPIMTRTKYPDLVQFMPLWVHTAEGEPNKYWVISVSHNHLVRLRRLLERGPVKVKARVDVKFFEGQLENVVGAIKGTSKQDEEIVLIAHLCHSKPSANDNASGCGLVLEIARTISKLMKDGEIARPRRTIRFILCAEMLGSIAYVKEYWEQRKNWISVLCFDMVGEDQSKCMGPLILIRVPDSLPSFLSDYCVSLLERLPKQVDAWGLKEISYPFRFEEMPYWGGTDVYPFSDADVGVPAVFFTHWPDVYYHTQFDTVDKVDPEELKRVAWAAGIATLTLANGGAIEAVGIMNELESRSEQRLTRIGMETCRELLSIFKEKPIDEDVRTKVVEIVRNRKIEMRHFLDRDIAAIDSTMNLVKGEEKELDKLRMRLKNALVEREKAELARIDSLIEAQKTAIESQQEIELPQTNEANRLIPKRKIRGPLQASKIRAETGHSFHSPIMIYVGEIYNYINGKRTIADIYEEIKHEYTPILAERIQQQDLLTFIRALERIGYVSIEEK